jgi:hypothetical protein
MIKFRVSDYEHHMLSTFVFLNTPLNTVTWQMRIKEMETTSISFSRWPEMHIMLHTAILKACNLLEIRNTAISENILDRKQ